MVVYPTLVRVASIVASAAVIASVSSVISAIVSAAVPRLLTATISRCFAMATSDEVLDELDPLASNAKSSVDSVSHRTGDVFTAGA